MRALPSDVDTFFLRDFIKGESPRAKLHDAEIA